MADFLDQAFPAESQVEEPAPTPETPIEQPVEAPQPEPEAEPAPEPAIEAEAPPEGKRTVPLPVFLDQRDELRELKRWKQEQEARATQPAPNPDDDPAGYLETRLNEQRFAMSNIFARQAHGDDKVEAAVEWAQSKAATDPGFAVAYMRNPNPIDFIVQQHQRDALLSDIGDPSKLDDWFAREAAKRGYAMSSAPLAAPVAIAPLAAAQPAHKPAPPRSLAAETGIAPKATPNDATAEFMAIFDKRAG